MIPAPDISVGETTELVTLIVLVVSALALAAWSTVEGVRKKTSVPLLALLGGVIALPIEPLWDVNVLFVFPFDTDPTAFTAFGRPIPLYLAFIYPAFLGWGSYIAYRLFRGGASRRSLLLVPLAFFVGDAIIEIAGTAVGVWLYYGDQAWDPFGWPIYFGVLNGAIPLLGGWLLSVIEPRLRGPARVLLALAVPTAYVGIYAAAGWPTWAALNADVPGIVVWVAGAATAAMAIAACWLVADSATRHHAV